MNKDKPREIIIEELMEVDYKDIEEVRTGRRMS